MLGSNLALLAVVATFTIRYQHRGDQAQAGGRLLAITNRKTAANPLDQLSSADIAVNIAKATRLPQAQGVAEKADTVNAQLTISATDEKVVAKPQVISQGLKSRKDIQKYVTQGGESISAVATKFGVTSDTIRWSNNLTTETLPAGKELLISPVNGIIYQVKAGDTIDSLASKYQANKDMLIAINDAEIGGLPVGQYIIIPDGKQPVPAGRYGTYLANSLYAGNYSASYGGNGYDRGYCTYYAAQRRIEAGHPLPTNLGNASTWKVNAQRAGIPVGNKPMPGAVIWTPPRDYYGHVGYVESVDADGTVHGHEMNVISFGRVSPFTVPAAQASYYSYIYY